MRRNFDQEELSGHVVVCGLGRFGLRIVELLRQQDIPVVVITSPETREDRRVAAVDLGALLLTGDFRFLDTHESARLDSARALILASSDDLANLETALEVRGHHPKLRIVMRHSDEHLAHRLERDFDLSAVLSPPTLVAPHFAKATLEPPPAPPVHQVPTPPHRRRTRRGVRPDLWLPLLALVLLFVAGIVVFHQNLSLSYIDSAYFTTTIITTVGFGDFNLHDEQPLIKFFGIILMFGGVLLLATLSSFLTNYILSGAAQQARAERLVKGYKNHVILCGLGSVGFAIARDLRERNLRVVIIDQALDNDAIRDISVRIPVLQGDAKRPEVLLKAGLDRAKALVVATSSDVLNLEIGLMAQTLVEERRAERPLRIVLRCFDPDLVRRIRGVSQNYSLLSAAEVVAPLFVAVALEIALTSEKEQT